MHFAYEGFRQDGVFRCFEFRGIEGRDSANLFSLEVEMPFFLLHRIPVQDGPGFCLRLLETALTDQPTALDRFRKYTVQLEDFQTLLLERRKKLAVKAHKAPRRPFRKPSVGSNLSLGMASGRHA